MASDKSQEIMDMEEADKAYNDAQSEYEEATSSAKSTLKKAQKTYRKDIKSAEKALEDEKDRIGKPLASFGGSKLYWDHIEQGKTSLALEEGMTIEVNAAGSTYTVVADPDGISTKSSGDIEQDGGTRDASGTGAAESRNLFISLKTSSNVMMLQCNPDKAKEARDYADAIGEAAANVTRQADKNQRRLNEANEEIARSRGNTAGVQDAKRALDESTSDKDDVNEAKRNLKQAIDQVPQDELDGYRKTKRRRKLLLVLLGVVVVLVVAVVLYILLT